MASSVRRVKCPLKVLAWQLFGARKGFKLLLQFGELAYGKMRCF